MLVSITFLLFKNRQAALTLIFLSIIFIIGVGNSSVNIHVGIRA